MELKGISPIRTRLKSKEEINEFIALAKNGDKEAFINLIEEYKLDMYRMGKTMLYSEEDIGDAIQETVLKAYQNIKKLQKAEFFKSWLLKIMVNECNNILRQKKKVVVFDKLYEEETYEDNHDNLERQPVLIFKGDFIADRVSDAFQIIPKGIKYPNKAEEMNKFYDLLDGINATNPQRYQYTEKANNDNNTFDYEYELRENEEYNLVFRKIPDGEYKKDKQISVDVK